MLIAEELLLIALDPESGRVPMGAQDYVKVGLSGALLAELALTGRVKIDGGRITVVPGDPPSDPLLSAALDVAGGDLAGRKAKAVVSKLNKAVGGVWEQVVERLINVGAIGREKSGFLPPTSHPVLDRAGQALVLADVREAAAGDQPLEPRRAVLLAFAGPCRLLEKVAPERSQHRQAKARIKEATESAPFGPEVKKVIDDLVAATAAASAAGAAAASAGS